ncbi:MAG: hypothetical protein R6U84_10020 [Candidatus Cloacimonadales bacterium]
MRRIGVVLALLLSLSFLQAEIVSNEVQLVAGSAWADLSEAEAEIAVGFAQEMEYATELGLEFFWENELGWMVSEAENNILYLFSEAKIEFGWSEMWKMSLALPFALSNDVTDEVTAYAIDLSGELAYGNLQEDLAGISYWEAYESGYKLSLGTETSLYAELDSQQEEDDSLFLSAELSYAWFQPAAAYMIKPSWGYRRQLNSEEPEEYELWAGLQAYKDLNRNFTVGTALNYAGNSLAAADLVNSIDFGLELYYLPREVLEFSLLTGVAQEDLSNSADPSFSLGLGFAWKFYAR